VIFCAGKIRHFALTKKEKRKKKKSQATWSGEHNTTPSKFYLLDASCVFFFSGEISLFLGIETVQMFWIFFLVLNSKFD
jgi:hypothetical protein